MAKMKTKLELTWIGKENGVPWGRIIGFKISVH